MNRPLRISLVTETYPPQVNGVSRTLDRLVRHCADSGDQLQLLLTRYPQAPDDLPAGVVPCARRAVPLPFYREVLLPLATPGMLAKPLAAFRPDLVHIVTEGPLGWAALRAVPAPDKFSFPSGHTMTAFAVWAVLAEGLPLLGPPFLVMAMMIGASRIFLGMHYPTDVLVGALLGSSLGRSGAGMFL
jgi:hypothetical protein